MNNVLSRIRAKEVLSGQLHWIGLSALNKVFTKFDSRLSEMHRLELTGQAVWLRIEKPVSTRFVAVTGQYVHAARLASQKRLCHELVRVY